MSIVLDGTTGITTPNVASTTSTLGPLTQALNLGSTGQIVFPATQNASANANTLDDYEEGTFTATSSNSGGVSGLAAGTHWYRKVGSLVVVTGVWTYTSATVGTGFIVTALPFPNGSTSEVLCGVSNAYPNDNNRSGLVIDNSAGDPNNIFIGFYLSSTAASNVYWSLSYRAST